jgi:hypothetical protein
VDDLVKVEPTPADRYLVFEHNGSRLASGAVSADVDFARTEARVTCGRVARFSFAEWVDQ